MILYNAFIIAFIVMIIYASLFDGMIFGKVRRLFIRVPEFWQKPIFACSICMCGGWGSAIYWVLFHISWQDWIETVLVTAGIVTMFVKISKD